MNAWQGVNILSICYLPKYPLFIEFYTPTLGTMGCVVPSFFMGTNYESASCVPYNSTDYPFILCTNPTNRRPSHCKVPTGHIPTQQNIEYVDTITILDRNNTNSRTHSLRQISRAAIDRAVGVRPISAITRD